MNSPQMRRCYIIELA